MPSSPIQILAVDDEPDLCALTKEFLEKFIDADVDTFGSVREARVALAKKRYDIIVSDYQMPGEDGIQFLKSLRAEGDKTPFILFTGKGREEVVIEALNNGADSYLQKGGKPVPQYAELRHRIDALVQRHRAEEALQRSEGKYRGLYNSINDGIVRSEMDGTILECNQTYLEQTGYTLAELKQLSYIDLTPEKWHEMERDIVDNVIKNGQSGEYEKEYRRKDGTVFPISVHVWLIRDEQGNPSGLWGTTRDLTDRKRAEEALVHSHDLMRYVIEHSLSAIAVHDMDLKYLFVSERYLQDYKVKERDIIGKHHYDVFPYLPQKWRDVHQRALAGEILSAEDDPYVREDGSVDWTRWECRPWHLSDGSIGGIIVYTEVITERKHVEEELRASEEKYRLIANNMADVITVLDMDLRFTFISPSIKNLRGYTVEEALKLPLNQVLTPASFRLVQDALSEEITLQVGGKTDPNRTRYLELEEYQKDGSIIWVSNNMSFLRDEKGQLTGIIAISRDITERKRIEMELKESEEFHRLLMSNISSGVVIIDPITRTIESVNDTAAAMFGDSKKNIEGRRCHSFLCPALENSCPVCDLGQKVDNAERVMLCADGSRRHILKTVQWTEIQGEEKLLECFVDISERKLVEEELQRQSKTFSILNSIISTANKADDLHQHLVSILETSLHLLDFDAGGIYLVDRSTRIANIVHSKNLPEEFLDEYRSISIEKKPYDQLFLRNEPFFTENYEKINPVASNKFGFQSIASIPLLSKGVAIGAMNIVSMRRHLINEVEKQTLISIGRELGSTIKRMMAEEEAKKSSKNLEVLFNSIDDMVFVLDMQGRILAINGAVQKKLSYSSGELTNTDVLLLHVPERRDEALQNVQGMIAGTVSSCPVPVQAKDGTRIEVETKVTRGWWNGKEVLIGVTRDITERKLAEKALMESEGSFRSLFNNMMAVFSLYEVVLDKSGRPCDYRFLEVNPEYEKITNMKASELIGRTLLEVFPLTELHWMEKFEEVCRTGIPSSFENYSKELDTYIELNIFAPQKGQLAMISLDITERKRAEGALKESEEKHRLLIENSHDVIYTITKEGKFTFVSPSWTTLLGHPVDQVVGRTFQQFVHADDIPSCLTFLQRAIESGQRQSGVEYRVRHADGNWRWHTSNAVPLKDEGGVAIGIEGIASDITAQKRAEAGQQDANRRLNLLSNITRHDINNQLMMLTGHLALMEDMDTRTSSDEHLHKAKVAANHISEMIQFTKEYEEIGIKAPIWRSVRDMVRSGAATVQLGSIELVNDVPAELEVFADPLIEKVFFNLIDNALKHGGDLTRIHFFIEEREGSKCLICQDDGQGISKDIKKKLFTRGHGKNTGLGLFLSREILAITGITITEVGEPGKGAKFVMTIPPLQKGSMAEGTRTVMSETI